MATATLSSKGQITIPKEIREKHHLEPGVRIEFLEDSQGVVSIWPVTDNVTRLKGMVAAPADPVTVEMMNQAIFEGGDL